MRALITGATGQDGTLLSNVLLSLGWEVFGTKRDSGIKLPSLMLPESNFQILDITIASDVARVVSTVRPDVIFHLAGISSVGFSYKNPELTKSVNVGGVTNLLEVLSRREFTGIHLINAASTEVFDPSMGVIDESSPMLPRSPYAESKAQGLLLCVQARDSGMRTTNAILSNHESYLRSVDFVTGKIAHGVAKISLGLDKKIVLGSLNVEKDWSSATDIVDGLVRIASEQFIGDIILANGSSSNLRDIVREAFLYVGISNWKDYVYSNEDLFRENEAREIRIDPSKALAVLGWKAKTPRSQWVGEMVQHHLDELST
jgi:GDPmannose 4,6-dehydratase